MKKYLLCIASYNDWRQEFFETYMSPRNKEYAKIHNFEYLEITGDLKPFRGNSNKDKNWLKFTIIRDMIEENTLQYNDIITHIDADMAIVNLEKPFLANKGYAYTICVGNTHSTALFSLKINNWTKNMVNLILDNERYNSLNNVVSTHERFGYVNSFWHEFREQASWYSLAGIKRHSDKSFWDYPDYGWHSDRIFTGEVNEWCEYSLDDLHNNVEIYGSQWNVTSMPGETDLDFHINPVNEEDVIIRHFAGGQPWRKEWFDK